ncbi:MAG: HAMP domain-containing sensor histidine kinase [Liquorilactobacillus nagelii]|uniref:histidine kinase n=2 Tax=Liquorilactobacillus nagelii TaxID=82688 RepID=A0A3Q8CDM4_9LACO|nr:HAMP domain-containing sensor histidine kinase [Liquorilactobacillus nagelii]AUJ32898.1 two-component sensor histidine kinase [Liquorilactobacillus nagelii]MCC7616354.1 two-component sensor histidine kinase [Liquorilactobacillus nagelii]MCI1633967.1 HAMP domain-containing histidine kinase [Liquorilactobacillus nagelii]MCP9315114.1 HAMP domain-containing histidine kinase [Liquorilactobacillus nagelii]
MKLTAREKSELFGEGVVTVILLLLLNLSVYVLLDQMIESNPQLANGIFQIKMSLSFGPNHIRFWSWGWLFVCIMVILDVFVVYWRLMRRYRQMQLQHVIAELHYIANGHLNHRIPFQLPGEMQRVVTSINALVDSTLNAMKEERQIEHSKDELITNVSHDIRTPLTSIIGYLGLIEDQQYHSQEELLKYTHTAFVKARQMKTLADDLFEYTKVRQSTTPLNLSTIDLKQLLEQLAVSFELESKKKQMVISTDFETGPIKMEADSQKLVRVFNNLITNAFKYGNGGSKLILKARHVSKTQLEVVVANDGQPIPKESLKKLFDRFYRVESSRSKETGGSGLGLAIAQSIVELHHGKIHAESNENWTQFIIELPIRQENKTTAKKMVGKAD